MKCLCAAVYQPGQFGVAAKKLKEWGLKPGALLENHQHDREIILPPKRTEQRKDITMKTMHKLNLIAAVLFYTLAFAAAAR